MVRRPATTLVACLVVAGTVSTAVGAAPERPARPATDVGGTIAAGTVWTRAGSPYVTTSSV